MRNFNFYRLILACIATLFIGFTTNAYVATYYTATSKLSTGRWVKIKISQTGMHQITYDQLREMGFSDPSAVSVYGYGGLLLSPDEFSSSLPDDLPAQPVYRTDDKIIFYGEADFRADVGNTAGNVNIHRNYYSREGYYFLSEDATQKSTAPSFISFRTNNTMTRLYHTSLLYFEPEIENPADGGALFFGTRFADEPIQTVTFCAPDPYDPAGQLASFKYNFIAKSSPEMPMSVAFPTDVTVDNYLNEAAPRITSASVTHYSAGKGNASFYMRENGDSIYTFTFSIPTGFNPSYAALDNAHMSYSRINNVAGRAQLPMTFISVNQNINFVISGANVNTIVWNVTNPLNITRHRAVYTDSVQTLTGSFEKTYSYSTTGHARLIAFDPTKELYKVEYVEEVANQNLHMNAAPDMLIITNDECQPYAERLAQAHKTYQNLDVLVVNQTQIFNEFSSGTPSAMGYRRFAKMFYDRNSSKFKYLLLFGNGIYDNRGIIYSSKGRLLTYQTKSIDDADSPITAYCADSYFGKLNDSYTPDYIYNQEMSIAVGRIPAGSGGDASTTIDKIIDYLQNPPTIASRNRALLLSDDEDNNSHLSQSQAIADEILACAPATTITRVYNSMYPIPNNDAKEFRSAVKQALYLGQSYFCYSGHGKPEAFAGETLWSKRYVEETEYSHYPIALLATCDSYSFDRDDDGIAENMLFKRNGGMIAVVGASRTVYKDYNHFVSLAFASEVFNAKRNTMIGDAYRNAHNKVVIGSMRELGVNTMCFNLAGDPALPIYCADYNVETSTINSEDATASTTFELYPLANNIISGQIIDNNGDLISGFNGTITLSLYEAPDTVHTYERGSNPVDPSVIVVCDEDLLAETSTAVVNGKFSTRLAIPAPQRPGVSNRLTYYAITDDKSVRATGIYNNIILAEYNSEMAVTDNDAPVISECYIDNPTFADGDYVNADVTLFATIQPDASGLNISTGTLGQTTKLTLDGKLSYPEIRNCLVSDQDGVITIQFPVTELSDGRHTLTLSVADNAGNRATRTISFVVINRSAQATLTIEEKPARTEANLSLSHNFSEEPSGRLVIEDNNGNTVFSKENCTFPYTWNLQDATGNRLPDGNYKAYVILNGGKQYGNTPKTGIVIIK